METAWYNDPKEQAWAAGVFDCIASMGIYNNSKNLVFQLNHRSWDILIRLGRFAEGQVPTKIGNQGRGDVGNYRMTLTLNRAYPLLTAIRYYVVTKEEETIKAIELYNSLDALRDGAATPIDVETVQGLQHYFLDRRVWAGRQLPDPIPEIPSDEIFWPYMAGVVDARGYARHNRRPDLEGQRPRLNLNKYGDLYRFWILQHYNIPREIAEELAYLPESMTQDFATNLTPYLTTLSHRYTNMDLDRYYAEHTRGYRE